MNSKNLICPRCQGQMQFLENIGVYECPYCGYSEHVVDSDQIKIEKMRIQEEQRRLKKEDAKAFKKSKFSKVIIVFDIFCAIAIMSYFSNGRILAGIIALLQLVAFTSAWLSGAGIIKEKFNGMHTVLAIVGFALVILCGLVSSGEKKSIPKQKEVEQNKESSVVVNTPEVASNQVKPKLEPVTETDEDNNIDSNLLEDEAIASSIEKNEEQSVEEELVDGMRPGFKETMDSYEAFFDEYIVFMQKYTNDTVNALSMMGDYTKFLTQYADTMEKMDALGEEDLNDAELKYYIEVTGRINQNLISAIQ